MVSFDDARGFVQDVPIEGIKHVALNMSHTNVVRGNHYHKLKDEVFLVISGQAQWAFENVNDGAKRTEITGARQTIEVPRYVAHKVSPIGGDDLYMLQLSNAEFDASDTYKYEVKA